MNYRDYFMRLIEGFLSGKYDRAYVAAKVASDIGIDEIKGNDNSLLNNCEWALRHLNEEGYYSNDAELKYYLSCLREVQAYSSKARDSAIGK